MKIAATVAQARALFDAVAAPARLRADDGRAARRPPAARPAPRARAAPAVGVSVFVNPLQFGANEDLARYPRDLEGDRQKLADAGVDALFVPDAAAMYPPDSRRTSTSGGSVQPSKGSFAPTPLSRRRDGGGQTAERRASRRSVSRAEGRAANGRSAGTSCAISHFRSSVEVVPTIRERDGLAMSSRNSYLTAEQRMRSALALPRADRCCATRCQRDVNEGRGRRRRPLDPEPLATPDYFDVVDAETFEPIDRLNGSAFVIGAARFGRTRLIDNLYVTSADAG